jgi:dihydroorotase
MVCIATDHAPHTIEDKETTFDLASYGMIGLVSCFGAVNRVLCKESGMDLRDLICLMTNKPRRIMGFDTDLFSKGKSAEITIIDPDKDWIFSKDDIRSKSINSPYFGRKLNGKIISTIARSYIYKNV